MPRKAGSEDQKMAAEPLAAASVTAVLSPSFRLFEADDGAGADTGPQGPRGQARCRAFLEAASQLFVEKGYEQTSLNDILRLSGGSRATLYEHFGDKQGLFRAVLELHCLQIFEDITRRHGQENTSTPQEWLVHLGLQLARTLCCEQSAAFLRTLISQGKRVPDIVASFVDEGPDRTTDHLIAFFTEMTRRGLLAVPHPETAASAFIGMIVAPVLLKRLILPEEKINEKELEGYVHQAVRQFLNGAGCGTRPA